MSAVLLLRIALMLFLVAGAVAAWSATGGASRRLHRLSRALGWTGWTLEGAALLLRWLASYEQGWGHAPLSNMYESILVFAFCLVPLGIWFLERFSLPSLEAILYPAAALTLGLASFFPAEVGPMMPALRSAWLHVHVLTCFIAYAALALGCLAAGALILRLGQRRLVLEEMMDRMVSIGFFWLTIGIFTGAVWAESAWGKYWSWDPKETWALITWLIYALYLHLRRAQGWRESRLAVVAVIGFAAVIFTWWGVNFLMSGLHSYV